MDVSKTTQPLKIVPKQDLSDEQLAYIDQRIKDPAHQNDVGPLIQTCWGTYTNGLFAIINIDSEIPIGLIESSGPPDARTAGWWIDSKFRNQGFGSVMIDALILYLKNNGTTGIGNLLITSPKPVESASSKRMAIRLKKAFGQ
jgi:RimJ/RimL family protein N-acetyltransferase